MRKILMFVFVLFGVLLFPLPASAQEGTTRDIHDLNDTTEKSTETSGVDNENYCTKGYALFNWEREQTVDGIDYDDLFETRTFNVTSSDGGYLYLVEEADSITGSIKFYICGKGQGYVHYTREYENIRNSERYVSESDSDYEYKLYSYFDSANRRSLFSYSSDIKSNYLNFFKEITIPLFSSEDEKAIEAYEKSGDTSGAINDDSYEYDESIELPHDVKFSGKYEFYKNLLVALASGAGTKVLSLSWQIPDDREYTYDVEVRSLYTLKAGNQIYTPWFSLAKSEPYLGDAVIFDLLNANRDIDLLNPTLANYINTQKLDIVDNPNISVRIRNKKNDKCSNWVVITVDSKGSGSAKVEDKDGNVVEDDEYTNSDGYDTNGENGGSVSDDSNNPFSGNGEISLAGILSYIQSGFGLLGNGGIIALMSGTFSYTPASVWVLIRFAIAINISIMILALIKRFVFS